MNHTTINKISDLKNVLEENIYVSGNKSLVEEETYNNMWALSFSEKLIKKIDIKELEKFLSALLKNRSFQLASTNQNLRAIFYLRFDKQALQLRFNLISGKNADLPFSSKLNILNSPEPIFNDFIKTTRQVTIEGDVVEFSDTSSAFDDEIEEEQALNVYVKNL